MKTKKKLVKDLVVGDKIKRSSIFDKIESICDNEKEGGGYKTISTDKIYYDAILSSDYEIEVLIDDRLSWDDYFFSFAKLASVRSHDAQTKHGCVIVKDNRIIGTGYNSFPQGMRDEELPNTRPDKYPFMIHSEMNAILNCVIKPENAIAYVTGQCCLNCLECMWQAGIKEVKQLKNHHAVMIDEKMIKNIEIFINHTKMKCEMYDYQGVSFSA